MIPLNARTVPCVVTLNRMTTFCCVLMIPAHLSISSSSAPFRQLQPKLKLTPSFISCCWCVTLLQDHQFNYLPFPVKYHTLCHSQDHNGWINSPCDFVSCHSLRLQDGFFLRNSMSERCGKVGIHKPSCILNIKFISIIRSRLVSDISNQADAW